MKFYINYIFKGDYEKQILPYESYIVVPAESEIMSYNKLNEIRNLICNYMEDLFNMEPGEVLPSEVIIRNWNLLNG